MQLKAGDDREEDENDPVWLKDKVSFLKLRDFPLATGYRIHSSLICNKHLVFMGSWDDKVIQY